MKIRRFEGINVVPFIDIMLVLLVIVLTTATFVARGIIPVDLAQASSSAPLTPSKELVISIMENGSYYLNDKAITFQDLESELIQYDKAQSAVMINADKHVSFEPFVTLLDVLKQHHFEHIGIVTKR